MKVRMVRKIGKYFITETGYNTMNIFTDVGIVVQQIGSVMRTNAMYPEHWPKLIHEFSVIFFSVHFTSFEKQKRITCSWFGKLHFFHLQ